MKTPFIIVAIVMILVSVCVPLYVTNDTFNLLCWYGIPLRMPDGFTVTAHSGCEGTEPNTIASMQAGYDAGVEIIEFDLHFNDLGECVLSHDKPQEGETYTTLEEAFRFLADHPSLQANLDLKSTDNMPFVYDLIVKYDLKSRVFFTGVNEERAQILQAECPGVAYYLNYGQKPKNQKEADEIVAAIKDAGAIGLNTHYSYVNSRIVKTCHENGLLVSVFTVDKTVLIPHVLLFAPDNVTTRRPVQVKKMVDTRKR